MTINPSPPLPECQSAEKGLLCSFLHSPDTVAGLVAQKKAIPEFFCHPDNRTLFETLLRMHKEGVPIDMISVGIFIANHKIHLETLTPEAYIAEVWCFTETAAMALFYLETLRESFARRSAILECQRVERELREDAVTTQDVYDLTTSAFKEVQKIAIVEDARDWDGEAIDEFVNEMESVAMGQKNERLMPTYFPSLDAESGGMEVGETYIIHGLTSTFKSVTAQMIMQNNLLAGKRGAIFSIEMGHRQVLKRLTASLGKISLRSMRTGRYNKGELERFMKTVQQVKKLPLKIYDTKRNPMTAKSILSEIRALKKNFNLDMVLIDYLGLVEFPGKSEERRCSELQGFSKDLKRMSGELDIVTLLVAQANKDGSVFDASQVESDGDGVITMVPKWEMVSGQKKVTGTTHIFVQKFREGRRGWKFPVRTLGEIATIEECQEVVAVKDF